MKRFLMVHEKEAEMVDNVTEEIFSECGVIEVLDFFEYFGWLARWGIFRF